MANFFGTDGIRGVFGQTLTVNLAKTVGNALAQKCKCPKVIIGSDTRCSSSVLRCALACGVMLGGGSVTDTGIVPTACVSYLTEHLSFDYGVMISASHNPPSFNGIKIFKNNGQKLSEAEEENLELFFSSQLDSGTYGTYTQKSLTKHYTDFLKSALEADLSGLKICLDCSNGSAYKIAPELFKCMGAQVFTTACKNDGLHINDKCGSLHIENLISLMLAKNAKIGFAFDGDSDRLIAVDERGEVFDGDKILFLLAKDMKAKARLFANTVVGTSHTNSGIVSALNKYKINLVRADVGDKYVIEAMQKMNLSLGGEQSGHIIIKDKIATGDGILSAICLLNATEKAHFSLHDMFDAVLVPQTNLNLVVKDKIKVINNETLKEYVQSASNQSPTARILVRASGTENKVRIMVEHQSMAKSKKIAKALKALIQKI